MRNLRRASQAFFLILFLFLTFATRYRGSDDIPYPVRLFLDWDPLLLLSTVLSSRTLPSNLLWSLLVVVITLLLGRVFCGWICPFGTLHHLMSLRLDPSTRALQASRLHHWYRFKYYLLIALLCSSLLGVHLTGLFDPLSLLIRSFSAFVDPALNLIGHSLLSLPSAPTPQGLQRIGEGLRTWAWESFLSPTPPYLQQATFIGLLFLLALGLNRWGRRFWCVALCPLGALLGLLSRFSLTRLRIADSCNRCQICNSGCQTAATPFPESSWMRSECIYCWGCPQSCPQGAIQFRLREKGENPNHLGLERRRVLSSALAGVLLVPLLRSSSSAILPSSDLIRPPGSLPEQEFLRRCLRCGECLKVCPTHGLQPALLQGGLEALWTPVLVPRLGYCEYSCTLCGQVCPTGAIKKLTLSQKQEVRIGVAFLDKNRCLPYQQGISCLVCEEHCPTPKKAIWLEWGEVKDRQGVIHRIQLPHVDLRLCIGCGICEKRCPLTDLPAIRVSSIGESRSRSNQLLLPSPSLSREGEGYRNG